MSRGVAPWWVPWLAARRKAVLGGLSAGLTALAVAWSDGHISGAEIPGIVIALLGVGGVVHQVTNQVAGSLGGTVTGIIDTTTGELP